MKFTDIFIRRPVLATVVSLMILVLGLRAVGALPVLQYPRTENAVVTVTTTYYGADPDVIAGFITTPLELAIAQANGIGASAALEAPEASLPVNRWIIAETIKTVQALDLALADLRFDEADVNDLLKSLVLTDKDGGKVRAVTYDNRMPVEVTLKAFAVDVTRIV